MVEFSLANAADFFDEDEDADEEPGEEIESAPPLNVGEEREISFSGIKKKLIKPGIGWETPEVGDEVTVHFVGKLLEGTKFTSTRDKEEPFTFKMGTCQVVSGLDHAIVTMRKGEIALFTIPPELGYGAAGAESVPPNSSIHFEVELVSWIAVVDVCKDGGIIKKVMEKGEQIGPPGDLDEVRVKYTAVLDDDTVVAKTPEEGFEFHVKDGHFCPALPKVIKTMKKGEKVKLIIQPQYAFEERKENKSDFSSPDVNSTLRIDLELLSFKPVIDVSGDSKILKKILKEGEGFTANEGASVTVRYTAMLEDGTVFEKKGVDAGEPMEFVTDEEQVIAGLDRAAMTMKKGEVALLTIHPEFGFGSVEVQRDLAAIPPSSTIIYEIEMLDFTREKAPWEMSDQERLEAATRKKEEGNLLFKNGKYQRAGKKYDKAVDYVTEDGSFRDNDLKLVKSLRVLCWLNGAACSLRVNDFQEAIKLCSKVLDVESSNVKALYRRAQAYMGSADLHLAELDIKRAFETDPQNREVKLLQKNLRQLQAESNKRDANLYSTMFSGRRKGTSPATKEGSIIEEPPVKSPDYSMHFTGGGPFNSKKELVDWVKGVGAQFNMFLIIARSKNGNNCENGFVSISCERSGKHRQRSSDVDVESTRVKRSKKCHCPFSLNGKEDGGRWFLSVGRGFHNHELGAYSHGYSSVGARLTETQMQIVADLTRNKMKPKEILEHIKRVDPNNISSVKTIYNARHKLKVQDTVDGSIAQDNPIQQDDGTSHANKGVASNGQHNTGNEDCDARHKLKVQDTVDDKPIQQETVEKGVTSNGQHSTGNEDYDLLQTYFQELLSRPPDERRRLIKQVRKMLHSEYTDCEKRPTQKLKGYSRDNSKRDESAGKYTENICNSAPKSSRSASSGSSRGKGRSSSPSWSGRGRPPPSSCIRTGTRSDFLYNSNVPHFFLPYIREWLDVARDGNCGYRAVAHFMYGDEMDWVRVRMELFREVAERSDLYAELLGGMERVREIHDSIAHWEGSAPNNKWMSMFDMGWVIAAAYNVLCVSISRHQCVSYLPLVAPEGIQFISRTIAIGYLQEEHHFMVINTVDDFPLPPLLNGWYNHSNRSVFGWDARLITRFNQWLQLSGSNS